MIDPLDAAFGSLNRIKELRKKASAVGATLELQDCWILKNLPRSAPLSAKTTFRCHNLDQVEEILIAVKNKGQ